MTCPRRMLVSRLLVLAVDHPEDDIPQRRFRILHVRPRVRSVGRDEHALMLTRAVRIEREKRRPLFLPLLVERLADDRAMAHHAGMADGRDDYSIDARDDHGSVNP